MSVFGLRHNCIGPKAATWSNFVALLKRGVTQVFNFIIKKKDIELFPYAKLQCNLKIKYLPTWLYSDIFGLRPHPHPPPQSCFFSFWPNAELLLFDSLVCFVSLQSLSTQQLVYLAIQIVKAVQFLHRKKILHKDIATRNCV